MHILLTGGIRHGQVQCEVSRATWFAPISIIGFLTVRDLVMASSQKRKLEATAQYAHDAL
jgi:hypothetical protein